jgi:hypothetical protein
VVAVVADAVVADAVVVDVVVVDAVVVDVVVVVAGAVAAVAGAVAAVAGAVVGDADLVKQGVDAELDVVVVAGRSGQWQTNPAATLKTTGCAFGCSRFPHLINWLLNNPLSLN